MELKVIYNKLENMSEQIAKLRESAARTENILTSTLQLQKEVDTIKQEQNKWKGAMVVISALVSIAASAFARLVLK